MLEPGKVADLDRQADCRQGVDPAQAPQTGDVLGPRRDGDQLADRGLEGRAAELERVDRADVLGQSQLRAAVAQIDLRHHARWRSPHRLRVSS